MVFAHQRRRSRFAAGVGESDNKSLEVATVTSYCRLDHNFRIQQKG
jgi:hypothetical protein